MLFALVLHLWTTLNFHATSATATTNTKHMGILSAHALKNRTRVRRHLVFWARFPRVFKRSINAFKKNLSKEVRDCKKITHFSISMDILRVFWEFGWQYCKDQSTNKTRYGPKEVEFGIWFTEVQDLHTRRQIMQVSIKMLKLYCYDSRGCMLSRSSDTPSFFRWKFWIWADFASTLKWVFIIIPPGPKIQITSFK